MSDITNEDQMESVSSDRSHDVDPDSHLSSTWKVLGQTDASDGIGVLGNTTSSSGVTNGVAGITDSTDASAAGVLADAPNGATGLEASVAGNFAADASATGSPAIRAVTDVAN